MQLKSDREVTPGVRLIDYDSELFNCSISVIDNRVSIFELHPKKTLYPEIVCNPDNNWSIQISYGSICIKESNIDRFEDNYKKTKEFIKTELKPLINDLRNTL